MFGKDDLIRGACLMNVIVNWLKIGDNPYLPLFAIARTEAEPVEWTGFLRKASRGRYMRSE